MLNIFVKEVLASTAPLTNIYLRDNLNVNHAPSNFGALISPLLTNVLIILGVIGLFYLIFAGWGFLSSGGDKTKVEQSTNTINHVIVGLLVASAAFVITVILGQVFKFDFMNPTL